MHLTTMGTVHCVNYNMCSVNWTVQCVQCTSGVLNPGNQDMPDLAVGWIGRLYSVVQCSTAETVRTLGDILGRDKLLTVCHKSIQLGSI